MENKMKFNQSVIDIIKKRFSCRTYTDEAIEENKKNILNEFFLSDKSCPFNTPSRFELIAATEEDRKSLKGLGTYGFIRGATGFIGGSVKKANNDLEDYGYLMEKIILLATDIGLGTCWLGGTFNKSNFANKISLLEDEIMPAVVAIGYKQEKRGTIESFIRWKAGSDSRQPWEIMFFNENFSTPITKAQAGVYADVIEMVRLAPSASNKQPWRIVKDKSKNDFHFFLSRTKGYDKNIKMFKLADLQRVDMGIAMCHFELTANELGLKGKWELKKPNIESLPEDTQYIATWEEMN
ncbi:MAG: nitroreductase family protein [Desulfobacterales bacterium]|nr:nitroreductase family protein [Desulfobacterales bacterium]